MLWSPGLDSARRSGSRLRAFALGGWRSSCRLELRSLEKEALSTVSCKNQLVTKNGFTTGICMCTLPLSVSGQMTNRYLKLIVLSVSVCILASIASLLPTLIAMTSQLTGMTLLPRHFTLKPIDFKCNILSDCDASTYLLVSRGAVVVRGDHSITVKVEILKASGLVPGSTEIVSSSPDYPSLLSWRGWFGSSTTSGSRNGGGNASAAAASLLVPGTGIERSKFVVCASGMQTSVVVRAGTDPDDEEEKEMTRLRKEREERLKRSSSSSSSSSLIGDPSAEDSIILGDSFQPLAGSTLVKPVSSSSRPTSPTQKKDKLTSFTEAASTLSTASTSTSTTTIKSSTTTGIPLSYAAAVSQTPHHQQPVVDHPYEETSDTEAWRK